MTAQKQPWIRQNIVGRNGESIVLFDWNEQRPTFCNLQKLGPDGSLIWTATPHHPLEGVWVDVEFRDGQLFATNYNGFRHSIDYETGRVLGAEFVK